MVAPNRHSNDTPEKDDLQINHIENRDKIIDSLRSELMGPLSTWPRDRL